MYKLAFAAAAAFTLAACASTNGGSDQSVAAASASAGTKYCWQDRLNAASGKLNCNWASTKREACDGALFTDVDSARVSAPRKSSMCSNGQWLVEVAPAG